jgi:4-amino-4-deoxy-L-arabinose transferase-like glycosyltransferase
MPSTGGLNVASHLLLTPEEVAATSQTGAKRRRRADDVWEPIRVEAGPKRRVSARLLEVLAVLALVGIALALRTYDLTTIPYGLHGDEATTGLEGQRILREGQIGPYSPDAMGQPTGPIYFTALAVKLLGNSFLAVRIVPALAGTLTVLALYFVARRAFGVATALIAATLLATMTWHVHFARIGFPLETWPLCVMLTAGALMEALRRQSRAWWAAGGALAGLGIYSYNAHPFFLAIVGLFVGLTALEGLARNGRRGLGPYVVGPLLMAATLLVTAWPMIDYARNPENGYFGHSRAVSIFRQPEWAAQETTLDKARFLGGRYRDFWHRACCSPDVDGVDGSGVLPIAPGALLLLAVVGGIVGLVRREPLVVFGSLVILLIPWASALTLQGLARRTFAAAPFLALFAALPLAWLVEQGIAGWRRSRGAGRLSPAMLVAAPLAIVLALGPLTVGNYFRAFPQSAEKDWVFAVELVDAINFLKTLPDDTYVYFLSERWNFDHETRRYLAPQYAGEDRSAEFGERVDQEVNRTDQPFVFIFFGRYTELAGEVAARYPQGTLVMGSHAERQPYVAYLVRSGATPGP